LSSRAEEALVRRVSHQRVFERESVAANIGSAKHQTCAFEGLQRRRDVFGVCLLKNGAHLALRKISPYDGCCLCYLLRASQSVQPLHQ